MLPAAVMGALAGGSSLRRRRQRPAGRRRCAAGVPGLPSLHSIIEAIANGFFGALGGRARPGCLKHGTVATIQHLVALPDPASWGHVSELESDMTYLGMC